INSAHDSADGGLAVAIAESCLINRNIPVGCTVNIKRHGRQDFVLFNESQSRAVISFSPEMEANVKDICQKFGSGFEILGKVTGSTIHINDIDIPLETAKDAYYNSISKIMEAEVIR
ncbi:MAG TPA: AIR synthase-related protein, partial [Ignavibacteria bacterium]|nr:AIR synthase-related protein [Ignavibacteria bacterium]